MLCLARRIVFLCGPVTLMLALALARDVSAQGNPYQPFAIDGVVTPTSNSQTTGAAEMDEDVHGNSKEPGPVNGSYTKFPVLHLAKPNDEAPSNQNLLGNTNPNGQTDLHFVFFQTVQDSRGHAWVYFGWTRDSNSGSGFVAFEAHQVANDCGTYTPAELESCNPWSPRTTGDFAVFWDQSGSANNVYLRTWNEGVFTPEQPGTPLNSMIDLEGYPVVLAQYTSDLYGGEMALDLTAAGVIPAGACEAFPSVIPITLTGNSPNDSADVKDAVLAPISIDTCATLKVQKVTLGADGNFLAHTTADFGYLLKKGGTTVGSDALKGCSSSASFTSGVSACAPDSDDYSGLTPGSDYTLQETSVTGKYVLKSIECNGTSVSSGTLTFTLPQSGSITCTITNQLPAGAISFTTTPTVKALLYDDAVITLEYEITHGATKTITFELFKNSDNCSSNSQGTKEATATFTDGIHGTASTLNGTAFLVVESGDTYYWKVSVPGDSVNSALVKCGEATTVSWSAVSQ